CKGDGGATEAFVRHQRGKHVHDDLQSLLRSLVTRRLAAVEKYFHPRRSPLKLMHYFAQSGFGPVFHIEGDHAEDTALNLDRVRYVVAGRGFTLRRPLENEPPSLGHGTLGHFREVLQTRLLIRPERRRNKPAILVGGSEQNDPTRH